VISSHEARESLVLDNRGLAFGSGGNAQRAPLPAVRVLPEGSVTVRDADVFVRDRLARITERVSVNSAGQGPDRMSFGPTLSADGSAVAFQSLASNLDPLDFAGTFDVFVRQR
jgi:hypothetical protein